MSKVIGKIYVTNDYGIFKVLDGNRHVINSKKIKSSIEKVGQMISPIAVNEKMEIIDGQHRFDAFKELGLPIYYYFERKGAGLVECQAMNVGQTNWTMYDYIESFAALGNDNYINLKSLMDDYKGKFGTEIVISSVHTSIANNSGGGKLQFITGGKWIQTLKQTERAREVLDVFVDHGLVEFKNKYGLTARSFFVALLYAYSHPEVDFKRLVTCIKADPLSLVAMSKVADQLRYFEEVYNKRLSVKNRVYMSADYQKELYLY